MPLPKLSIILPTYNRAASLQRAIQALLRQDAPARAYEIVVVDNNSVDGTATLLAAIDDPRLRTVRESRQGLSFARNAGIAAARGDIIAFTDDDVEVAPDWVSTILSTLDARPDVDGVGGRVLPAWERARPSWLTRSHWAPLALQDHGDQKRVFDRHRPVGLIGANVALRRGALDRTGRFSTGVQRVGEGVGSTEDHDLLARLYAAGGRMLYTPRMLVLARIQPDRCERDYHRRWHQGHGRFHALMRLPETEASRFRVLGVPAHLLRAALRDAVAWTMSWIRRKTDAAFDAELRLRFFLGYVAARTAGAGR
jgi:glycosyltransferase involved in cell wall biosynthesis